MKKRIISILLCIVLLLSFSVTAFAKKTTETKKEDIKKDATEFAQAFENSNGRVFSVARYGDVRNYPENSIEGINACVKAGLDIISVDIQRTKDDQFVLLSSNDLSTTCAKRENGSFVGGSVSDYTLKELKENFVLRAGHGGILAAATACKPVSLSEAIEAVNGKAMLMINNGWKYNNEIDALAAKLGATKAVILRGAVGTKEIEAFLADGTHVYVSAYFGPKNEEAAKSYVEDALKAGALLVEISAEKATDKAFKEATLAKFEGKGRAFVSVSDKTLCGDREDRTAGWDELISLGFSVIETDYPSELASHLQKIETYRVDLGTLIATAEDKITAKGYTKVTLKALENAKDEALDISSKGAVTYEQIDSARYHIFEALENLDIADGKNDKVKLPGWLVFIIVIASIVVLLALAIVGLRIYNKVKKANKRVKKVKDKFQIIAPEGNDSLTSITGEDLTVEDFAPEEEEKPSSEENSDDEDKDVVDKANEYIDLSEEKDEKKAEKKPEKKSKKTPKEKAEEQFEQIKFGEPEKEEQEEPQQLKLGDDSDKEETSEEEPKE